MTLVPYNGPVLPVQPRGTLKPYNGPIVGPEDTSNQNYQDREFGPQGQVPAANKPVYQENTSFVDKATDIVGTALNPIPTAIGKGIDVANEVFDTEIPNPYRKNRGKDLAGAIINAPKEIATTAVAAGEAIDEHIVDPKGTGTKIIPRGSAAWLDQNMPEYHPQDTLGAVVTEVGQAGIGGGIAGAPVKAAVKNLPKFFRWAATLGAGERGASVAIDQDTQGLTMGEDPALVDVDPVLEAVAPIWGELALDPNGDYHDELLKKRMKIFTEGALISKTGEKLVRSGIGIGKFVNEVIINPGKTFFQKNKKEEAVVREMVDTIIGADNAMTNEERHQAIIKIADQIDANSKVETPDLSSVETPTGQQLPNTSIKRDTMSSYTRGLDTTRRVNEDGSPLTQAQKNEQKQALMQKAKADMMRAGQQGKGASDLEVTTGQGAYALKDLNEQTHEVFGGRQAIEQGKDEIIESGHKQVDNAKSMVFKKEDQIQDVEQGAESLIKDDEVLGSQLPRNQNTKLDLEETSRVKADEIVDTVAPEGEFRTKQSRLLHEAIPEDAQANLAALNEKLDLVNDRGVSINEVLDDTLRGKMNEAGDNFKKLNKFANFELQREIDKAKAAEDWTRVSGLRSLKRHINEEQLDYLAASGDTQTRDAAEKARDYFKKEVAPYYRQGVGEEILETSRDKARLKPGEFRRDTRKALRAQVQDPDSKELNLRIHEVLKGKGKENLLSDYALGNAAAKAQEILQQNGKLTTDDVSLLKKELYSVAPVLEAGGKKGRLEEFFTKLDSHRFTKEELEKELADVVKARDITIEKVYGEELKEFMTRSVTGFEASKKGGYEIFNGVLENNPEKVDDLIRRLDQSNDPLTKSAFKSAYGKWAADKLFESTDAPGNVPKLNMQTIKKDKGKILEVGDKIFVNQPEIMVAQRILMDEAEYTAKSQTQRALPIHDLRDAEKGMRDSVATVITFAFGTLDRLGARVRAASGRAITSLSRGQQAREIMNAMYSDPDRFTKVLRQIADKDRTKLSKESKDQLYDMFTKGLTFADYGVNENKRKENQDLNKSSLKSYEKLKLSRRPIKQQTEKALPMSVPE